MPKAGLIIRDHPGKDGPIDGPIDTESRFTTVSQCGG